MKQSRGPALAVWLALLAAYHLAIFTLPFSRDANFWLGYLFTLVSFLLLLVVCLAALGGTVRLKSALLKVPVLAVGWTYCGVQLVLGLLFILLPGVSPYLGAVLFTLLLGVSVICILAVPDTERQPAAASRFLALLQDNLGSMARRAGNRALRDTLRKLARTAKQSAPRSDPQLEPLDTRIAQTAARLSQAVDQADGELAILLAGQLEQMLSDRDAWCARNT